ncbi:hypothetical protein [Thalassospira indica]|uniref:Uncharacterized protein n=1 Tax=Thalassospira indica TaxID=1891279 RepID=A0ABM6XVK9_9PROT|nr:hypothetical protein [Thalassospira indica]AXO13531.1 hypothetical protein DY252_04370 [Thalassospira indica]OAZ14583.1 hypothetical protein TH15_01875 [Thalassospira profundimaris]
MAQHVFFPTGRLNDAQIMKLMRAIVESFGRLQESCRFGNVTLDLAELESVVGKKKTFSIDAVDLVTDVHKFTIYYRRGTTPTPPNGQNQNINIRVPSPYFDEVIVLPGQGGSAVTPSATDIHGLTQLINAHLILKTPDAGDGKAGSAIDILQAQLADLSALQTRMVEESAAERAAFAEERRKISDEVQEEIRSKRTEYKNYIDQEEARISELERKVKAKQKELDDRDHMHVRRQLRESITSEISDRVAGSLLPKETSNLNIAICVGSFLIACVAGYFALSSFASFDNLITAAAEQSSQSTNSNFQTWLIAEFLRGSLSSFACIGFLVYTVSWLRRTYIANVKVSQDLQKYSLDINRASWTIETIMEMTTKEGRVLPDRWIDGACHGLFQTSEQDHAEITPMEAWTALLSGAARVQHGPQGTTLELSGKEANKMARSKKT